MAEFMPDLEDCCKHKVVNRVLDHETVRHQIASIGKEIAIRLPDGIIKRAVKLQINSPIITQMQAAEMIQLALEVSVESGKLDIFLEKLEDLHYTVQYEKIKKIYHEMLDNHRKDPCAKCGLPDVPKNEPGKDKIDKNEPTDDDDRPSYYS